VEGTRGGRHPSAAFVVTRRIALAITIAVLTVSGHSAASGMLPSTAGLVLTVLIAASLTLAATSSRRSWAWLVAFLLGSQLLLHAVLVVSSGHAHMVNGPAPLVPTGWMALAHVVVTFVAAGLLVHGAAILDCWVALLTATLGVRMADLGPISSYTPVVRSVHRWWSIACERVWDSSRRGPPALSRA